MAPRHLANEISDDGGRGPDDRGRTASRHGAALLSPQGPAARPGAAVRLRPLCPALPRPADLRLADGPADRARKATRRSARGPARSSASSSTSSWIDAELRPGKRGGAFSSSARAQRPSVHPDELHRQAARRDDAGPRAGPRPAPVPVAAGRLPAVRHAVDHGGDGQRLRRDADLPAAAGAVPRAADPAGHAVQQDRGRLRHGLPPGGADALRAGPAPGPPRAGRADDRADQRAVAGRQPADARRRGAADRRLRLVVDRTSAISSTCRSTATPTPSASCWCWPWCRSTSRKGRRSCRSTWSCSAAGGSDAPHVLLARLGVDVTDPAFWELGLRLLGDMVAEAEQLAEQV